MNLTPAIAAFFRAFNAKDADALAATFAADAKLADEGHEYRGTSAIKEWFGKVDAQYKPTIEAIDFAEFEKAISVTTQISGSFPGSPIQTSYKFAFKDNKIAKLVIGD
jgi:ketosteroid isomerase-like protein